MVQITKDYETVIGSSRFQSPATWNLIEPLTWGWMGLFPIISSLSHSVTVYFSSVHKSINWTNRRAVGSLMVHFRWLLFIFWPQGSLCFRSQLPVRSLMFKIGKSMFLFISKVAHCGYHTDHVELKGGCYSHPFIVEWLKVCWGGENSQNLFSALNLAIASAPAHFHMLR